MMNRIALYSRPHPNVSSWFDMVDESAKRGMTVLEAFTSMDLGTPDPEVAKKLRAYADAKGVQFCCLSCYCVMTPESAPQETKRMMDYVDIAAILGSPYYHHTVVSGYPTPDPVLENWDAIFDTAVSSVRKIADHGKQKGVRLIYEDQGYMINGVENYGKFLDAVGEDVGVLLDMGNNYNVDEELDGFLEKYMDRICHVHVKDVLYGPTPEGMPDSIRTLKGNYFWPVALGEGIMELEKYVKTLEQKGYTGVYALEYGSPSEESTLLDDTVQTLSGWLAEAGKEIKE